MPALGLMLERASFVLFLMVLISVPVALGGVQPGALLMMRLAVFGAVGVWLLAVCCGRPLRLPRRSVLAALAGYLIIVAVSASQSAYRFSSVEAGLNTYVHGCALLLASAHTYTAGRRRVLIATILATAGVMGAYGLAQFLGWQWTPTHMVERVSAFFYNSNHYSGYLALVVPLVGALLLRRRRGMVMRIALAALFLLLTFNLVMTFSWGLLATSTALVGMLAARTYHRSGVRAMMLAVVLAGVLATSSIAVLVAWTPQLEGGAVQRTREFFGTWVEHSIRGRVAIAGAASRVVGDNPLTGVGPGNLIYAITRHRPSQVRDDAADTLHMFVNYAHNDYLQVASETGLLGLVAFVSLFIAALVRRSRMRWSVLRSGFHWGLVALMLHGLTDGNMTVIPANGLLAFAWAGVLAGGGEW